MNYKKLKAAICCFTCAASLVITPGCSSRQITGKETNASQKIQATETSAGQNIETKAAEQNTARSGTETEFKQQEPGPEEQKTEQQESGPEQQKTEQQEPGTQAAGAIEGAGEEPQAPTKAQQELMLYITLGNGEFQTYPYTGEGSEVGEGIPACLIQGIADITGWNLTLADEVYSGKGGISVIFSSESSLFKGPPENQVEEFHVYDSIQMTYAILDSIQKTLQHYASAVNPDSVDIWYAMENDQPLTIDSLGVILPIEQPYSHEQLSELLANSTE